MFDRVIGRADAENMRLACDQWEEMPVGRNLEWMIK